MKVKRSPITTHVLDVSRGKALSNIPVILNCLKDSKWVEIAKSVTDEDGRCENLLSTEDLLLKTQYRLVFDTKNLFDGNIFYPEVAISFQVTQPHEHHHVPLLLSPFGYSTYRGT